MAVIHISEAEAARDFAGLLAKVRSGDQVRIDTGEDSFDLVPARWGEKPRLIPEILADLKRREQMRASLDDDLRPRFTQPRLLSEILADMEAHPSDALLDDGFADALEEGIRSHEQERLIDPWEAF